jgi:hypothetical protein
MNRFRFWLLLILSIIFICIIRYKDIKECFSSCSLPDRPREFVNDEHDNVVINMSFISYLLNHNKKYVSDDPNLHRPDFGKEIQWGLKIDNEDFIPRLICALEQLKTMNKVKPLKDWSIGNFEFFDEKILGLFFQFIGNSSIPNPTHDDHGHKGIFCKHGENPFELSSTIPENDDNDYHKIYDVLCNIGGEEYKKYIDDGGDRQRCDENLKISSYFDSFTPKISINVNSTNSLLGRFITAYKVSINTPKVLDDYGNHNMNTNDLYVQYSKVGIQSIYPCKIVKPNNRKTGQIKFNIKNVNTSSFLYPFNLRSHLSRNFFQGKRTYDVGGSMNYYFIDKIKLKDKNRYGKDQTDYGSIRIQRATQEETRIGCDNIENVDYSIRTDMCGIGTLSASSLPSVFSRLEKVDRITPIIRVDTQKNTNTINFPCLPKSHQYCDQHFYSLDLNKGDQADPIVEIGFSRDQTDRKIIKGNFDEQVKFPIDPTQDSGRNYLEYDEEGGFDLDGVMDQFKVSSATKGTSEWNFPMKVAFKESVKPLKVKASDTEIDYYYWIEIENVEKVENIPNSEKQFHQDDLTTPNRYKYSYSYTLKYKELDSPEQEHEIKNVVFFKKEGTNKCAIATYEKVYEERRDQIQYPDGFRGIQDLANVPYEYGLRTCSTSIIGYSCDQENDGWISEADDPSPWYKIKVSSTGEEETITGIRIKGVDANQKQYPTKIKIEISSDDRTYTHLNEIDLELKSSSDYQDIIFDPSVRIRAHYVKITVLDKRYANIGAGLIADVILYNVDIEKQKYDKDIYFWKWGTVCDHTGKGLQIAHQGNDIRVRRPVLMKFALSDKHCEKINHEDWLDSFFQFELDFENNHLFSIEPIRKNDFSGNMYKTYVCTDYLVNSPKHPNSNRFIYLNHNDKILYKWLKSEFYASDTDFKEKHYANKNMYIEETAA